MVRAAILASVSTEEQAKDTKASIPTQIAEAEALCKLQGWQVVARYVVPGHSRYYISLDECIAEMMKHDPPITAFRDMRDDWEHQRFDVLVVRAGDRIARTGALLATIIESIIKVGRAKIFMLQGGEINENNYSMVLSMLSWQIGYFAQSKAQYQRIGMQMRMERGLPATDVPLTHRLLRDERGKGVALVIDEEKRRLLDHLGQLILAHVSWRNIAREMAALGFLREDGKPYVGNTFRQAVLNPYCWGHSAMQWRHHHGRWAYDEAAPLPKNAKVRRNTHEPAWTGEVAEAIKQELIRRGENFRVSPRAAQRGHYVFTGLLACRACGCRLIAHGGKNRYGTHYAYWRCTRGRRVDVPECAETGFVRDKYVREWLDTRLRELLAQHMGIDDLIIEDSIEDDIAIQVDLARRDVSSLSRRLEALVADSSTVDGRAAREVYRVQIDQVGKQLDARQTELDRLQALAGSVSDGERYTRRIAFEEIQQHGIDWLWELPTRETNALLRKLLGSYRLIIEGGKIIGLGVIRPSKFGY